MPLRWFKRLYFGLLLAISPLLAFSGDAKTSLDQFNQHVTQAQGQFIQTVIAPDGSVKQEGEGVFSFAKPGQFRWEITSPFPQLIISDGKNVITYDPDLEQASKRKALGALESSPSALLFGHADLDKLFKIDTELEQISPISWLKATPLKQDSLYEKIRIGMRDGKPTEVEIHDSLGQVTHLSLYNWNIKPVFEKGHFSFVLPKGVDMIEVE